jgi:thioredoxin 2
MSDAQAPVCVPCSHCEALVRIPAARLDDAPKCPRCHQMLLTGSPVPLTSSTFKRQVGSSDLPVVVDFWAPWCGPCLAMAPQFESAAASMKSQVRFGKVNTEEEGALAGEFGIRSIPTMILFRDGREVARQSGAMNARSLVQWISANSGQVSTG